MTVDDRHRCITDVTALCEHAAVSFGKSAVKDTSTADCGDRNFFIKLGSRDFIIETRVVSIEPLGRIDGIFFCIRCDMHAESQCYGTIARDRPVRRCAFDKATSEEQE